MTHVVKSNNNKTYPQINRPAHCYSDIKTKCSLVVNKLTFTLQKKPNSTETGSYPNYPPNYIRNVTYQQVRLATSVWNAKFSLNHRACEWSVSGDISAHCIRDFINSPPRFAPRSPLRSYSLNFRPTRYSTPISAPLGDAEKGDRRSMCPAWEPPGTARLGERESVCWICSQQFQHTWICHWYKKYIIVFFLSCKLVILERKSVIQVCLLLIVV